jgi:hypothetical protein
MYTLSIGLGFVAVIDLLAMIAGGCVGFMGERIHWCHGTSGCCARYHVRDH